MLTTLLDVAALACLLFGAVLCLLAAIGLLRFPDLLSRMHAATKPQVLGILLILLAVGLSLRSWPVVGTLVLVGVFQMLTAPISSHMISRSAVRTGQIDLDDDGADADASGHT